MEFGARYHPSLDQLAVVADATAPLAKLLPLSRLHASHHESDSVWSALDELGLFGMTLSEELGGTGLGATEEALMVIELGRHLVAPAVVASLGVTTHSEAGHCRGSRVAAGYRHGDRIIRIHDAKAEFFLLRQNNEAQFYTSVRSSPLDSRLWLAELHEVTALGKPVDVLRDERLLRLRLLDGAILAGIAAAALDMAVSFASVREQFGRAIGSFQAVKHHCANMAVSARRARDQTCFAAIAMDDHRGDAELQVESALLTAGTAALKNAGLNIQIHGGMGFSDEADPHLLLKRAQLYLSIAGGLEATTQRIANIKPIW